MRILEAKHSGFCPGVKRAVDTAQRLTNEHPDAVIATLGELI
ncbi:MAG: 4-hydroxy-3-methylbut-2-enyl diphosphate reductase, partial [Clostridia bacterium]|nr:4-hydroxy-3-methylbut-2-enyl diphosphate reductase [Clostridia bacterium]